MQKKKIQIKIIIKKSVQKLFSNLIYKEKLQEATKIYEIFSNITNINIKEDIDRLISQEKTQELMNLMEKVQDIPIIQHTISQLIQKRYTDKAAILM
jgi:hypothetical protein